MKLTKRLASSRVAWLLSVLNVLALAGLLGSKSPEYAQLRAADEKFWSTGELDFSSADPMYLAARPFYSSVHVSGVPLIEDLYFNVNTPAMLGALSLSYPLADLTSDW